MKSINNWVDIIFWNKAFTKRVLWGLINLIIIIFVHVDLNIIFILVFIEIAVQIIKLLYDGKISVVNLWVNELILNSIEKGVQKLIK